MQRNVLIGSMLAACGGLAIAMWMYGGTPDAPTLPNLDPAPVAIEATDNDAANRDNADRTTEAASRRADAVSIDEGLDGDPEIRAAMCGFKGRVVDHRMQPQVRCGVRVYRGAVDSVLKDGFGKLAELSAMEPNYVAGEILTDDRGEFVLHGVWPHGFYLMLAGIGTDAPTHQMLTRTPAPGEVVDLGDIVLNDAAVATGTVVDENGNPVSGALVMAADLPGAALDFVPAERFDPKGCLLVREGGSAIQVIEMPAWVATLFERLPIPMTRSGADGAFRLTGIAPGMNFVVAVQQGLVPAMQKSVKFEKGATRDLGELKLREGEEVTIKVVDTTGKAIEGAEVVAGTTSTMAPVDFASRMGMTDKDGRVTSLGFGRGKATAAARRSPRDPWTLAEPQPMLREVVVTLPAVASIQARVTIDGKPVADPKLHLLSGKRPNEAAIAAMFGAQKPIDLADRVKKLEDGRIEITDIALGHYTLLAKTEGTATGLAAVEVTAGAAQVSIELKPSRVCYVRVLGPADVPVRNAAIYALDHDSNRGSDMIQAVGRTDREGKLSFDDLDAEEVRVTAEHPKWGMTHARAKVADGEITLRFLQPGWIEGTLTKGGKPAPVGKHAVLAMQQHDWETRSQAVEGMPTFATPGLDGAFALRALQPGKYRVETMPALEAIRSPGGMRDLMEGIFDFGESGSDRQTVDVVSGQGATCALELDGEAYTGPVGNVYGTVQIDGAAAEGAVVQTWGEHGRRSARADAAGRFELRDLPASHVHLTMRPADAGGDESLWATDFELAAGQSKDLLIDVRTTSMRGIVRKPDGSPAVGLTIGAQGQPLQDSPNGDGARVWRSERIDQDGKFAFERIPEGRYQLQLQHYWSNEGERYRGELKDVVVEAGRPRTDLVLQLHAATHVKGRVDLSPLAQRPEWAWMSMERADPAAPTDRSKTNGQSVGIGVNSEGEFDTFELEAGMYWATLHFHVNDQWMRWDVVDRIELTEAGASNLLLRIQPQQPAVPPQNGGK